MPRRRGSSGTWCHLEALGVGTKLTHGTRALRSPRRWPTPCPSARIAPPMKPANPRTYSRYSLGRRRFLALVSGSLLAAPLVAEAQPVGKVYRVGFLGTATPSLMSAWLTAFRAGLRERGYVEGKNIAMEYRWGEGKPERFPGLAAELVKLKVDVIVTSGPQAVRAVQHATTTIPIVVAVIQDPVELGFVTSLAR